MFRISFMVRDKDLPACLHAVKGFALNMEVPQPVVHVSSTERGTVPELVARELAKMHPASDVTSQDVSAILQALGRSPASAAAVINVLMQGGILRRVDKGIYRRAGKSNAGRKKRR